MEHLNIDGIECKKCTKCGKILPLTSYNKDRSKKDNLSSSCKECIRKKDREIYCKNPQKKYEQVINYQRKTRLINKYKPYNSKYYSSEKSKEKKKIRDEKRHMLEKKANAVVPLTKEYRKEIYDKFNGKCAYCGVECGEKYHIDHIVPLCKGGTNEIDNLSLSCPMCNWKKGKKLVDEFCF